MEDAEEFVDKIVSRPAPADADDIFKLTEGDLSKKFASELSRDAVDRRHGVGKWRPMVRFMVTQATGKQRAIDDAKQSEHNEFTRMHETI